MEHQLQQKILLLEKQLEEYRKKEDYINTGIAKTKEAYDIARHNAEKIMIRAIEMFYDFKQNIVKTLNEIDSSKENFKEIIASFLKDNQYFLNIEQEKTTKVAKEIVEKMILDNKKI